ncbi:putative ABC transporter ATP-binding protein YbbL [bacterium BMS3Bbin04]|nr:putative ABC transporter ATP-binding protein YbbL [bacterium BMS3Bbin04]
MASVSSSPHLEFRDVSFSVADVSGDRLLTDHLDLQVPDNQIIVIKGSSGSGKSTLLRACIRLHEFNTGDILLSGRSIRDIAPTDLRRRVAYLRQFPIFSPGTVRESLCEAFSWQGITDPVPGDEELATSVLSLDLDMSILDQDAGILSAGEAQRVALLRAQLVKPEVLLLDESTANLDPEHEAELIAYVRDWVKLGRNSAIWVTHDRLLVNTLNTSCYNLSRSGLELEGIRV